MPIVQHCMENTHPVSFRHGSVIAWLGRLGNGYPATEGGIPKSSRSGHSLKSLAFSGCVRRREEALRRVERDYETNPRVLHPEDPEPSLNINLEV